MGEGADVHRLGIGNVPLNSNARRVMTVRLSSSGRLVITVCLSSCASRRFVSFRRMSRPHGVAITAFGTRCAYNSAAQSSGGTVTSVEPPNGLQHVRRRAPCDQLQPCSTLRAALP